MDNAPTEIKRIKREKFPQEPPNLIADIAEIRGCAPSEVKLTLGPLASTFSSGYKNPKPRPKMHIEPMNLREELAKIESSTKKPCKKPPPPSPSIRKELFKPARTTSIAGRPSFSTRQSLYFPASKNVSKKTSSLASNKPVIKIHKASPIKPRKVPNVYASPIADFLEMEAQCEGDLDGMSDSDLVSEIAEIRERDRKLQEQHSANLERIDELVKKLALRKKPSKQHQPAAKEDLLKNLLKKKLELINEEKSSPRREKGLNLYNSLRNDFVLETPRKFGVGDNDSMAAAKSFSEKIQEQCLLLQDTPRPPK